MKTTRLITTLLASLALTTTAFAADAATAFTLKGQARVKTGENYTQITVGNGLADGSLIQVSPRSTLGIKTTDGGTVFFSENTSFRIRYVPDSGPGFTEITLLSGTVSGDFNTGAAGGTIVRTSVGVVNTNGGSAQITFTPSNTGSGTILVVATSGSITFTPPGSTTPVVIQAGSFYTNDGGTVRPATETQLLFARGLILGSVTPTGPVVGNSFGTNPGSNTNAAVSNNRPDLSLLSPNGEGQTLTPAASDI